MKVRLAMLGVIALAVTCLTACQIPASPTPRVVNNLTILDNPEYMNNDTLNTLNAWWHDTHNPAIAAAADSTIVSTEVAATSASEPPSVTFARALWFQGEPGTAQNVQCALGILFTGGAAVFTAAAPPVGLAGTIVAWFLNGGSGALSLADCWNTFQSSVEPDGHLRWLDDCRDAYLTADDWNMLNPAWEQSSAVKFQQCVVIGWAAMRAAGAGYPLGGTDDNGNATAIVNGTYHCEVTFPVPINCHWI